MPKTALSFTVVLALGLAGPAVALAAPGLPRTYAVQAVENPTPQSGDRFGDSAVALGDVNGDQETDFVVGIDEHGQVAGEVFVFSGDDGSLIYRISPPDADAGGGGDNPDAFGTFVGKIADIGSCPGFDKANAGQNCAATQGAMDTGDGVPDIVASAIGVDVDSGGDDMGTAYVIDGASGAVLKRIRMPSADRTEQAANEPAASQGPAFGRTILSPAGLFPCEGNAGVGACPNVGAPILAEPYNQPTAVRTGDVDGGGKPDIYIGASDFTETAGTHPNCTTKCFQAGRAYVFRGEDLAGLDPTTPLETAFYRLKNPSAGNDDNLTNSRFHREAMGYSVQAVGDLGRCTSNTVPIASGDAPTSYYCMNASNNTTSPDGKPEIVVSSHRSDIFGMGDSGTAFVLDGATGRILDQHVPVEPQVSALFGFSNYNQPPMGDLGSSTAPDVYHGAMVFDVQHRAQGRGWVLTGDFRSGGANHYVISVLDDPTPDPIGNFSTSSAGVGDVFGDGRNELIVGAYGPHAPQVVDDVIGDVHIFDPLHGAVLQTIADPAQDKGGGFGRAVQPLGDLNEDGFLDFVVGSGGYGGGSCSPCTGGSTNPAQGRMYILRSDNSPAPETPVTPPATAQPGPEGPAGPTGPAGTTAPVRAGRGMELDVSRSRVPRGRAVRLDGFVDSFTADQGCERNQAIQLQRRRPGRTRYATFRTVRSDADGEFGSRIRPARTFYYRAVTAETSECHASRSNRERVTVLARR